jgi:hypothetical protein
LDFLFSLSRLSFGVPFDGIGLPLPATWNLPDQVFFFRRRGELAIFAADDFG